MTNNQLLELKSCLLALKASIQEQLNLGQDAAETITLDQTKVGRVSRIDAIQQQIMAENSLQQAKTRYRSILKAISKIESEDYSFCENCGEEISFARLKVHPEAPLCLSCQALTET